jgi:hypothetical protein
LPASSSVTIWRPRGNGIGSSKRRFQPRSATGALAVVDRLAQSFHSELDVLRLQLAPTLDLRPVALLRVFRKYRSASFLAAVRSRVNFSRRNGSLLMGASKRDLGRQAI